MEPIGLAVLTHEQEHEPPPGHPENGDRLKLVVKELATKNGFVSLESPVADLEPIFRIHDEQYVNSLIALAEQRGGMADADTYITPTSMTAARIVVGALLDAVDRSFADGPAVSFILGRPPGHHAGNRNAMGFCLINNIAVAAQYALDNHAVSRIAIVDFDVHHGNGTQDIFYERHDVFYVSTHQYPFYPGTGSINESGSGDGEGYTLNFPLPAGTDDDQMLDLFNNKIVPALRRFQPQLLLISAGFDAHRLDPLGGFQLTGMAYCEIAGMLKNVARLSCNGRMVTVLEGGYDPRGNLDSITGFMEGLRIQ